MSEQSEMLKVGDMVVNKTFDKNSNTADIKVKLDTIFSNSKSTLDTILNLDDYDPSKTILPQWVISVETELKNELVKYSGQLPRAVATLYASYLLEAGEWLNRELSRVMYFEKKASSYLDRVLAQGKSNVVIPPSARDSDTLRERIVKGENEEYRLAEEAKNKAYAFLNYFKSRTENIEKSYYLCKSFATGVGTDGKI